MVEVIMIMMLLSNGNFPSPPLLASRSSASRTAPSSSTWEGKDLRWVYSHICNHFLIIHSVIIRSCAIHNDHNRCQDPVAIIKIIIRSCGTPLASSLSPGLGDSMIAQGFKKVSANLAIFKLKFSTQFLVVAGPLPCWRSVIDTFLPTQSSSLIGQSLMLRPILNKFIHHDNDHQVPQMIIIMITTHGRSPSSSSSS